MDPWVDPYDPDVIKLVAGTPDASPEEVETALRVASELLAPLSGYRIHPAGQTTQTFIFRNTRVNRLSPAYKPITEILSVTMVDRTCATETDVTDQFCIASGSVRQVDTSESILFAVRPPCRDHHRLSVSYLFGSTVNLAARRAVCLYARQFWLFDHPESGECLLPERVNDVNREGMSYTFVDPMTFLDAGRTGVPMVDTWLAAVNPSKAKVPAAVYTPESPPGSFR